MNPIDKFTNIDAVYPTTDAREEDIILDYVWDFALLIHPAEPKIIDERFALEGTHAISTFKKRYNERLIKMPRRDIDDRRKEIKKAYLAPYQDFEAQVKELLAMVDAPLDGKISSINSKNRLICRNLSNLERTTLPSSVMTPKSIRNGTGFPSSRI